MPEHELLPDLTQIQPSGLIDADYYRINPVGQYENELDPALHYCRMRLAVRAAAQYRLHRIGMPRPTPLSRACGSIR